MYRTFSDSELDYSRFLSGYIIHSASYFHEIPPNAWDSETGGYLPVEKLEEMAYLYAMRTESLELLLKGSGVHLSEVGINEEIIRKDFENYLKNNLQYKSSTLTLKNINGVLYIKGGGF